MAVILASKDINSPIDKIWNMISNVDKDPEYWRGTRSIKNIKKRKYHRKRGHNII
jgi:hypothetical protein